MPRLAFALCLLLLAALPAAAESKVRKGPSGAAFYTPPTPLPAGAHGAPIWARKGSGGQRLLLYRSTGATGKPVAVSGTVAVPKGRAPKGGWPVISWAHGTTGIADRCAPSRGRRLRAGAARALAEGRLRDRAHRLRGARHAGRAPVPDRALGGPRGARRRARRAQARPAARPPLPDRRALAGRPRRAVGGVAGAAPHARAAPARHGRVRARLAPRRAGRRAAELHPAQPAQRPRRADPARSRRRAARPRRLAGADRAAPRRSTRARSPSASGRWSARARSARWRRRTCIRPDVATGAVLGALGGERPRGADASARRCGSSRGPPTTRCSRRSPTRWWPTTASAACR